MVTKTTIAETKDCVSGDYSVKNITIYEQMLGYIRREPFVVCRVKI